MLRKIADGFLISKIGVPKSYEVTQKLVSCFCQLLDCIQY